MRRGLLYSDLGQGDEEEEESILTSVRRRCVRRAAYSELLRNEGELILLLNSKEEMEELPILNLFIEG